MTGKPRRAGSRRTPMSEELLARGRARTWIPFGLALLVLVGTFVHGAMIYGSLSDQVPLHWGADGQPTRFGEKSVGNVFLGPLLTLASLPVTVGLAAALPMMMFDSSRPVSDWTRLRSEGAMRGTRSGIGWLMVLILASVWAMSAQGWHSPDQFSGAWPMVALFVGMVPAMVLPYLGWRRWARRTAAEHGVGPTEEEAAEDKLWLPLGLYNNPDDPRVFPPKREGHGMGTTVNLATTGGRIFAALMVLVILVPLVIILVNAL